jgi:serine/threonine-protein kinase
MGEVYRATDTTLGRQVAIKVLPDAFAQDAERLARFEREAKTLASLNHPNIAAIYAVEKSGGTLALVMELVEGDDLSQRIARGAIPLDEALPIAKQIADALEAAHEQGIIHRDLKPANIKVRSDGTAKVLDFGLAKAMEPTGAASASASMSPTLSLHATQAGMILGTAAYMAPERARGKAADKRADIWAFGCVLFEMLSGKPAFDPGETVSDAIAAILSREPDWSALPAATPPHVRAVLQRCLQKDLQKRMRDVGDARIEIDEAPADAAANSPTIAASPARPRPRWRDGVAIGGAILAAGAIGAAGVWQFRPSAIVPVIRFPLAMGDGMQFSSQMSLPVIAISQDGTQIVYAANQRLYLRLMSELEARPIQGTDGLNINNPVFSPDGRTIAFEPARENILRSIAVTGGAPVTLGPIDYGLGISWDDSGILVGQGAKGIVRVALNGGAPETLVAVKSGEQAYGPQMLPDRQTLLFTLATSQGPDRWNKAKIVAQSLKTGERKILVDGGSDGRYVPTGHLLYAIDGIVLAVPFDPKRVEVTGGPVPIITGVLRSKTATTGTAHFSFSNTGSLVYLPGPASTGAGGGWVLAVADRNGSTERLKVPARLYAHPRVSPDGKHVAVDIDDGKDANVWIYELSGASAIRQLTFGGKNRLPIWSPDSRRVAFQSDREGDSAIFWQPADGTVAAQRLTKPEAGTAHTPESWSPDGAHVLFNVAKGPNVSLWTLSVQDKKIAAFGGVESSQPTNAAFSPDGRWVSYAATDGGASHIYVQPFPATGAKYQVSIPDGVYVYPTWSRDGRELFSHQLGAGFAAVSVTTRAGFTFGSPVLIPGGGLLMTNSPTPRTYDVTPNGKFIGMVTPASSQTDSTGAQIQFVLNWFEELKARVPRK